MIRLTTILALLQLLTLGCSDTDLSIYYVTYEEGCTDRVSIISTEDLSKSRDYFKSQCLAGGFKYYSRLTGGGIRNCTTGGYSVKLHAICGN